MHTGVLTDGETWDFYLFKNDDAVTDESSNQNMSKDNTSDDAKVDNSDTASDRIEVSSDVDNPFESENDKVPKNGISLFTCIRIRIENRRTLQSVFGSFIDMLILLMCRAFDLFHRWFCP